MASLLEPEIQFAQRLACNEKPIRTKAIKKLRKYIRVRSQHATGGFGSEELLKLWKGLFYCLWMQDKPLLQEELSNQISTLIHSFHNIDGQLLYLESFLLTLKREWTGIDRLRMDKFFQLVRFMFRQTFEMLKRKNWESSEVERFVKLLTAQLLHSGSEAPCGLQLHILDLYMTELAVVGSAELTADQNLIFIEPFCKTAAKTKDVTLFRAICSSIFSSIIEQAPFAIEELLSEVKAEHSSDCDSGQASEEDIPETDSPETSSSKGTWKQMNGNTSDDDDDDDECYSQEPGEDDIGPVLQFDYAALADKLFDLASRSSTPSHNRQRLYKIIKVLRDLNEGVFPQVEYPEEVSTDEDDEMFGSRKRMKRRRNRMENVEEVVPATKKSKGSSTLQQDKEDEAADLMESPEKNKKRKKKKKKTVQGLEDNIESSQQDCVLAQAQSAAEGSEGGLEASQAKAMTQSCISSGEVSEAQSPTPLISEPVTKPDPCSTDATVSAKTRKKGKKVKLATESKVEQDAEITLSSTADSTGPAKKGLKSEESFQKLQGQSHVNGVRTEADFPTTLCEDSVEDDPTTLLEKVRDCAGEEASEDAPAPKLKKKKTKGKQEDPTIDAGTILKKKRKNPKACPEKMQCESGVETPAKKKKLAVGRMDGSGDVELQLNGSSSGKAAVHRRKIIPVEFEYEAEEVTTLGSDVGEPSTSLTTKKSKKAKTLSSFITFQSNAAVPTPLFCKTKGSLSTPWSTKKNSQTPKSESKKVTFGLKNNKTAEFRKSDRSLLVSPDGSSRVPFDPKQKPKVGVLKSPAKAHTANVKKKKNMKSRTNIPKNSPKVRPSAADFF